MAGDDHIEDEGQLPVGSSLLFHYQKAPQYRTVHVDGFWGGATPRGGLAISFFNERLPIPKVAKRTVISRSDNGIELGPEVPVESLDGAVRQIDATLAMDVRVAQELYQFLGLQLENLEKALGMPENERVIKAK
jgi:hypothetical protein